MHEPSGRRVDPTVSRSKTTRNKEGARRVMSSEATLHRWSDLGLQKVTAMISRKVIEGDRQRLVQAYHKRGAQVPIHTHPHEQMIYVLQGALRCLVGTRIITVREGEVLHVPAGVRHHAEAIDDTFDLVVSQSGPADGTPNRR